MRLYNWTNFKNKNSVCEFSHFNYYDKKYYGGEFYESAIVDKTGKVCAVRFAVCIKQKKKIIAFATGFCSSWEYHFNAVSKKKIDDVINHQETLKELFNTMNEYLGYEGFDRFMYEDILCDDSRFGSDNGYILYDKIYVDKAHRGKKLTNILIKAVEEKYDTSEIVTCICNKPFAILDFENKNNLKRLKQGSYNDDIWYSDAFEGGLKKNTKIITKKYKDDIAFSKFLTFDCSSKCYKCYVITPRTFKNRICKYGLPF